MCRMTAPTVAIRDLDGAPRKIDVTTLEDACADASPTLIDGFPPIGPDEIQMLDGTVLRIPEG